MEWYFHPAAALTIWAVIKRGSADYNVRGKRKLGHPGPKK
jgi:hypothetical protein